jgi:hypothetical protein
MDKHTALEANARLVELLSSERGAMVDFILALADFDRQGGWVTLGYTSLFYYLNLGLKFSKGAAYYRMKAVELIQRCPEVADQIRDGRLCITALPDVAKVVTPENAAEVLPQFEACSRKEAKAVAEMLAPEGATQKDAAGNTRWVAGSVSLDVAGDLFGRAMVGAMDSRKVSSAAELTSGEAAPAVRKHRLELQVTPEFMEMLAEARLALSHKMPGAADEAVLMEGLRLVIKERDRRKGLTDRPRNASRKAAGQPPARDGGAEVVKNNSMPAEVAEVAEGWVDPGLTAEVKRTVWRRDAGRCQWRMATGGACGSRERLEFDHVVPRTRFGESTVDNLRILCRFHNQLAAKEILGMDVMERFMRPKVRGRLGGL